MTADELFREYRATPLGAKGRDKYVSAYYFSDNERMAQELLKLVLDGRKRATASLLLMYGAHDALPRVGDINILTDYHGRARAVIMNTRVTILPFERMTFDICSREGEDECLETWREAHFAAFTLDAASVSQNFDPSMLVVFEDFEVVYTAK